MKIHELLSDRTKWTQGCAARDEKGNQAYIESKDAVCFCLVGALDRCYGRMTEERFLAANKIKERVKAKNGYATIPEYNDAPTRTYEQVLQLVKELDV